MAKKSKIIACIVMVIACVTCCFLPIVVSADTPDNSNDTVFQNPYCPTMYGSYFTSSGELGSRQMGGYAQNYRFLTSSRSTMYMATRYLEAGQSVSIFNDGYNVTTFDMSDPTSVYYNNDSIIYGCSTALVKDNGYLYIPFYQIDDFGLNVYVSQGERNNYNVLDVIPRAELQEQQYFAQIQFVITYVDGDGDRGVYEEVCQLADFSAYQANDFQSMRTYLKSRDEKFTDECRFYSIGLIYDFDFGNLETQARQYANTLVAIGNAESYVADQTYSKAITSFGYERGFEEGSQYKTEGLMGLITTSLGGFLNFELWENFTLGTLLMICMAIPLFVWIVKLLAGG